MPQRVNLKQGQSTTLGFRLDIPPTALEGTVVCVTITVGRDPNPQFNSQGDRFISCSVKQAGELQALSEKEGRRLYRELTGPSN